MRLQKGFGPLGVFSPSWLDGQRINEISSYSVGALRPLFLYMCLSVSCLIHDNPGKNVAHEFSPCSCYPIFMLISVCGGRESVFDFFTVRLSAMLLNRYDCMVQCWSVDPYKRPSFEKIEELLSLALELLPSNELDSSSVTASVCARLGYNLRSPTRSFDFSTFSSGRVDYPGQLATPHRGNTYKLDNSSPLSLNNAATNMSGPPCCCDSGRCDCKAAKCGKSRCSKGRTLGNIPSTAKVVNVMQSSIEPANMQENDYVIMSSDVSYTTRSTCSSGQGSDESSQKSRAKDVVSIKLSFSPKGTKTVKDCERLGTCRRSSSLEGIKPLELAADHKWSSSNDAAHRHPPVLCSRLSPNRAARTASLADLSSSSGNELPSLPPVSLCPANAPKQFKTSGNSDGIVHVFHV